MCRPPALQVLAKILFDDDGNDAKPRRRDHIRRPTLIQI